MYILIFDQKLLKVYFNTISHCNPHRNQTNLLSPEKIGLDRNKKKKQFWNQTTAENKLGTCRMLGSVFDENKELFENAPPHMIIRPYFQEGLYISSGQISKLIVKLTYIHAQRLTKPHEYYDKSVSYTFASLHKSI